jgi:hypothetical protein
LSTPLFFGGILIAFEGQFDRAAIAIVSAQTDFSFAVDGDL